MNPLLYNLPKYQVGKWILVILDSEDAQDVRCLAALVTYTKGSIHLKIIVSYPSPKRLMAQL